MTKNKINFQQPLIGAHISASGGLYKAFERANSIQCTTMQIFTKSNQTWYAKKLSGEDIAQFHAAQKEYADRVNPVVVHASYLINLCSEKSDLVKKSCTALFDELERCQTLNIPYLVVHPGAAGTQTLEVALTQLAQSVNDVLERADGSTQLLLENMAGQGTSIGDHFEQYKEVLSAVKQKKLLGFCLDTCHAFAAGYDFRTEETYKNFFENIEKTVGIERIKVIHMNDSKKGCGERVDRHEAIGKGQLGLHPFELIMNDKILKEVPKILETPHATMHDDEKNLMTLRSLVR